MYGKTKILLSLLFIALFTSCKLSSGNQEPADLNLPAGYTSLLRTVVVSDTAILDTLRYFYSIRNYQPALIKSATDKKTFNELINILNSSSKHGIDPTIYGINEIQNEFNFSNDTTTEGLKHLSRAEYLMTKSIVNYSNHLRYGIINPSKNVSGYHMPVIDSSKRKMLEVLDQKDYAGYFAAISPQSERYKKLQQALVKFDTISTSSWKKITSTVQKKDIIARLAFLGFINSNAADPKKITPVEYKEAVKNFQRSYGFVPDGNIGKPTLDKLNITPKEYVEKIKLNLERFRWINYSDSTNYLLVNIPDFHVRGIENGVEQFNIRVCTGKKRPSNYYERYEKYRTTWKLRDRPDDWETPQLVSSISYFTLNPTWTVPFNIVREEIFSGVRKDSLYLEKKNFKIMKGDKEVYASSMDIRKYSPEKIPFTFVQRSGGGNALGKIKFMFKNPFDVYLHDTPTRAPFSRSNRAVSHGCVRVEKPYQIAEYILKNDPKWNVDYIKIETGVPVEDKSKIEEYKKFRRSLGLTTKTGETTNVILAKRLPVIIDYYTAWVDEKGIINMREDVYNKDSALKDLLSIK